MFEDEEIAKILPFLALPDGAHLVRLSLDSTESLCSLILVLIHLLARLPVATHLHSHSLA